MHGPIALMEKPIPAREVVRKEASLGETRKLGTAGNGATKASAPEARTVLGRLPTLRRRREVELVALARRNKMPVRGDKDLEREAGQKRGKSLRRGGTVHA